MNNDLFPILQLDGFRQILSPQIPQRYLMRQIGMSWYRMMEEVHENALVGTRILVRQERVWSETLNTHILHDYITTRQAHPTFLGSPWTHQDVAYVENEISPYPYDIDAYHPRDSVLSNHWNNQNMNPLEEGQVHDMMDLSPIVSPVVAPAPAAPALLAFPHLPPLSPLSLLSLLPAAAPAAAAPAAASPVLSSMSLFSFR